MYKTFTINKLMPSRCDSNEMFPTENTDDVKNTMNSSDDESVPVQRTKKRVQQFSDSDTENENLQIKENKTVQDDKLQNDVNSETESSIGPFKRGKTKSRIQMDGSSSDSGASSRYETLKNEEQQMRMKNKGNKLKDKFKGLLSSRGKHTTLQGDSDKQSSEGSHGEISDHSDNEMSSIAKIKQKIKKSMASMSSICDPDTSDEEDQMNEKKIPKQRPRKQQKAIKLIEPKPVRMSAKQAMENMQLIKSESNRMLREKAVSLPYHRPKALCLKDIMSRRKPAVALDGKALPIKMNEEQLKHYALLLEQRQKEMMELCKSESDDETIEAEEKSEGLHQATQKLYEIHKEVEQISDITNIESEIIIEKSNNTDECAENETITDMEVINNDLAYNELIENDLDKTASAEVDIINTEADKTETPSIASNDKQEETEKNDSKTDFNLVYNDSVEEEHLTIDNTVSVLKEDTIPKDSAKNYDKLEDLENNPEQQFAKVNTEPESQLISLHYTENNTEELEKTGKSEDISNEITEIVDITAENKQDDFFSDDDLNMDDIDRIIEDSEILRDDDNISSPMLVRDSQPLNAKPKLMGSPGMVIDLDGGAFVHKKLNGVELLKERFTYFARLKTPEELEREKEKRVKPGAQHSKLKHDLEEKIAEQRSLEWAKRLEEEKQQHMEMETILDDAEESLEKIEGKLEEDDANENESSSESEDEEELEENDIEMKDKPKKHNPMLDNEAEESDCDENEGEVPKDNEAKENIDDGEDSEEQEDDEDESSDDESSESEQDETTGTKKGRILKAFEDSDDEDATIKQIETKTVDANVISNEVQGASQDDVIQLAQRHASASDDLFTSQESSTVALRTKDGNIASDEVLGTQTFSILDSTSGYNMDMELKSPSKLNVLCMSQPYQDPNLNGIMGGSQLPMTQSSQSQPIGEDILALCTGKFYDNEFVSPTEGKQYVDDLSQSLVVNNDFHDTQTAKFAANDDISREVNEAVPEKHNETIEENKQLDENSKKLSADGNLLKSILDELDDPEFDKPKANKFFTGGNTQKKENEQILESTQMKKKFTIESDDDDEATKENVEVKQGKKKKLKKRKPEKRALHISDDEDEEEDLDIADDEYMSDLENETERLVEYDSEENEIELKPDKPKKNRKMADFFEQEAELTSEDEWVGSGDEDEKGLDRMEREEGDDDVFHQGQLRKELGQIHMRDVLDQDKREVRIIQELLFEDGDLGDGHRQRKFRWRIAGEDEETGTVPDEFGHTQEEEFESEEQWRKQRHEREVFLRQMQQDEEESNQNVNVNRTTIIKANLSSKSMSTLLLEVNQSKTENTESPVVQEKKTAKDIPSPKKSFTIFQQNYHGSLLTRGRGALARLAALATPLVADDDAPNIGSLATHKRNFVFTALTQEDDDVPKVTIKRKAENNLGTPKLVKKMKTEEKLVRPKSSLLDHLNL